MGTIKVRNVAVSPNKDIAFIAKIKSFPNETFEYDHIADAIFELIGSQPCDDMNVYKCRGDSGDDGNRWDIIYTLIGWDAESLEIIRKEVMEYNKEVMEYNATIHE